MAFRCGLTVASLLLVSVHVRCQNVAPGDENSFCFDQSTRETVSENRKVLLDTQNYREQELIKITGDNDVWRSENFDGKSEGTTPKWIEQAQTAMCLHTLFVCAFNAQPQNNWLITQYINITDDGVDELIINMTFTTSISDDDCVNCQQSFAVRSYETDVIDETGRSNQSLYGENGAVFFHRLGGTNRESAEEELRINSKGLYLAVVDKGSCTAINRIYVFYYVCPAQVANMVEYPETVSPPSNDPSDRPATGTCIDNASPVESGVSSFELECNVNGNWESNDYSCSCDPGYEQIMESCEPCMEGLFKSVQGNEECTECPENSNSTVTGSAMCQCFDGHYRATNENATVKCTAPPTAPVNLHNTSVGTKSVTISWSRPTDTGGRTDLYYSVMYSNGTYASQVFSVVDTQYTITGLTPSTQYAISVISINGVSDQEPDTDTSRTASITVKTNGRGPTMPTNVNIPSRSSTILQWSEPDRLFSGTLLRYNILSATEDNFTLARIIGNTTETSIDLSTLNLQPGIHYIWVQAVTSNGIGELSESVEYEMVETGTTGRNNNELIAGVGVGVGVFAFLLIMAIVVVIVIIILVVYRGRNTKYAGVSNIATKNHDVSATHPELELEVCPFPITNEETSNRMYVDPRNYSSLNQAFDESGVKEIPPKEISNLEEIGLGEFGLVYKGTWSLKNVKVAVKTLKGGATDEQKRNFLFEASVMGQFHHPNVVKLYGIISRIDPIMIIMEYLENGSLDRYLQKHLDKLGAERQLRLSYGVAVGMSYLSKIGFVHRDLAARNILVDREEKPKVADFGLAREMVENEYDVQRGGRIPVRWTAPEAISHRSFTTASDVWSFGVLLWEIMTYGETPYEGWDNYTVLDRLERGERLRQPMYCRDDIYQLMLICWAQDRADRPTFEQICEGLEIMLYGKPKPKPKPKHLKSPTPDPPSSPSKPTNESIDELLESISMSKYITIFHSHNLYTIQDCFDLSEDDLKHMGITLAGHQYKIIKNIKIKQDEMGKAL